MRLTEQSLSQSCVHLSRQYRSTRNKFRRNSGRFESFHKIVSLSQKIPLRQAQKFSQPRFSIGRKGKKLIAERR